MAYELTDLKKAIDNLETSLNGQDLAPFKLKLEFSLLQIHTALKVLTGIQASTADSHNKYLLYKQLETTISEIQAKVQVDSHDHAVVRSLAESGEFSALAATKPFLIAQQKEWLPHYLEKDLQTSFDNKSDKNKIKNLCSAIKKITSDSTLNAEQKTRKIDQEILKFAESKGPSFSIFKDPLKSKVKEWLAIHRQATINPLFGLSSSPKPSSNQ